jgi:ribosomal protein L24E
MMPKCKFCGKIFDESVGVLFVKKDGSKAALNYFCSKKCENQEMLNGLKLTDKIKKKD